MLGEPEVRCSIAEREVQNFLAGAIRRRLLWLLSINYDRARWKVGK